MCWELSEHPVWVCCYKEAPKGAQRDGPSAGLFGDAGEVTGTKISLPWVVCRRVLSFNPIYLIGRVERTIEDVCFQGDTPNKGIPGPLYPDSPCTWSSPTPHTPCTHLFVQRWFLVWGPLAPDWILPLSHSGSVADFKLWPPYLPVSTGLRVSFYITKQGLKTSSV